MRKFLIIISTVSLLSLAWSMPAVAQFVVVEIGEDTSGVTTYQWNEGLLLSDYDCSTITVAASDLGINVIAGDAAFVQFLERENEKQGRKHKNPFTPVSTEDKRTEGTIQTTTVAEITFQQLHFDEESNLFHGTAHLWWEGEVDEDGVVGLEATTNNGVNVHVERPGAMGNCGG